MHLLTEINIYYCIKTVHPKTHWPTEKYMLMLIKNFDGVFHVVICNVQISKFHVVINYTYLKIKKLYRYYIGLYVDGQFE